MERVSGHPRPPSVEALVYRGCPCRDPPVCHRVQDDSVAERQRSECGWCVCFHLVSACERFCELVLCDGVLHRETKIFLTNCDSRVLWHVGILTHLLDDKRCLASSLSFPTFPTPLFNVTPDMVRRISSSPVVHSELLQLSFELKLFIWHAVCSRRSENCLFVYSRSLPV